MPNDDRCVPALVVLILLFAAGCATPPIDVELPSQEPPVVPLQVVASFPEHQLTGVAVSLQGRVFVNFPRWGGSHDLSVAEVVAGGAVVPYPNQAWNAWSPGDDPTRRWVCVQSVWVDAVGTLWVLDPASPRFEGVVPGGAKLVAIDPQDDEILQVYPFGPEVAPKDSYLNDVRVDTASRTAFITDSNLGALVVLDLATGEARRVFEDQRALHADPDLVPVIGGRELRGPGGDVPRIHSDGIAFDPGSNRLYLHALTGRALWSIPTAPLRDVRLGDAELAARLERHGETVVTDGMLFHDAEVLHTALERDAIIAWSPRNPLRTVVRSTLLSWPDSLAVSPDGWLYITTSQIHLDERFGGGRTQPYRLLRTPL